VCAISSLKSSRSLSHFLMSSCFYYYTFNDGIKMCGDNQAKELIFNEHKLKMFRLYTQFHVDCTETVSAQSK